MTGDHSEISVDFLVGVFAKNGSVNPIENTKVIQNVIAAEFNLSASDLIGKSRKQTVVLARGISIYLCRELLEISYLKIGSLFGGRDHSTIMHAYQKYKKIVDDPNSPPIKKRILKFQKTLSSRFTSSFQLDD